MRKRQQRRLTAAVLAAMLAAGASVSAYAANIELAPYPGAQTTTQSSVTQSAGSASQSSQNAVTGENGGPAAGSASQNSSTSLGGDVLDISGGSQTSGNSTTTQTPSASGSGSAQTVQTPSSSGSGQTTQSPSGTSGSSSTSSQGPSGTASQSPSNMSQTNTSAQTSTLTIPSNITKPTVSSEAAVLMDAATGQILFSKNPDEKLYPASITKLMTALLTAENASLDDTVTYQASAVEHLESGAATVKLVAGDTMTVRDSLYALLLRSACEVANGLAEHVSGTQSAFAAKMNERAKALGCTNTNFTNASGLNDTAHVTTAHDMALIARAAFANETVRRIAGTLSYDLPASKNRGALKITNGNKMLNPANAQYYEGIVAGKTGYTSKAGNTFATEVTRNGRTLIVVVMKSKSQHYNDTKALFDYGFQVVSANAGGAASGNTSGTTPSSGSSTNNTTSGTSQTGPSGAQSSTGAHWQQNGSVWNYVKADGTLAKSEWIEVNGKSYYIGSNNAMITGWQKFSNGAYYYFDESSGAMLTNAWKNQGSGANTKSYYLQSDGTMAVNKVVETKQGKYRVDANGVAVEKLS